MAIAGVSVQSARVSVCFDVHLYIRCRHGNCVMLGIHSSTENSICDFDIES